MRKITPIATYEPLPWQLEPLRDTSPVVLLTGSAGGGKSRCAAEKVHAYMLRYPEATGLMLRKAREFASKSIVPFARRNVIGKDPFVTYRQSAGYFEYANGSALYWGGMRNDDQREAIRSMGPDGSFDIVWLEEANAFSRLDFDEILARMRGKAADWRQIILTTNPDSPAHWIHQDLILGSGANVYYSSAQENPHNPPDYAETLSRLTGVLADRLVRGLWVQAEGAIYGTFDAEIHVIDPFEIPNDWRRLRAIDFGYTNPFVCQWWALNGDGDMFLYREIYHTGRTVRAHAEQIRALSEGEPIEATICDHDAEDRATLAENGIINQAADKRVSIGIERVKERLRKRESGKPRLCIMCDCLVEIDPVLEQKKLPVSTLAEISGYVWANHKTKEVPVKENDHGCDAMRYAAMYVDGGSSWDWF
jgi:phage terminase large subunit